MGRTDRARSLGNWADCSAVCMDSPTRWYGIFWYGRNSKLADGEKWKVMQPRLCNRIYIRMTSNSSQSNGVSKSAGALQLGYSATLARGEGISPTGPIQTIGSLWQNSPQVQGITRHVTQGFRGCWWRLSSGRWTNSKRSKSHALKYHLSSVCCRSIGNYYSSIFLNLKGFLPLIQSFPHWILLSIQTHPLVSIWGYW